MAPIDVVAARSEAAARRQLLARAVETNAPPSWSSRNSSWEGRRTSCGTWRSTRRTSRGSRPSRSSWKRRFAWRSTGARTSRVRDASSTPTKRPHDGKHGRRGSRAGPCALAAPACRPGPGARRGCRAWCAPTGVARGQVLRHRNLPVDRQISGPAATFRRTRRRASPPRACGQVLRHRNLPVDRQVSRPAATFRRTSRRASPPRARGQVLRHRNLPVDRQVSRPAATFRPARRRASPSRACGQVLRHRNLPVDRQVSRPAATFRRTSRRASPPRALRRALRLNLPVDRQVSRPAAGDGRAGWQASAPPDAPRSAPARGPSPGADYAPASRPPLR